MRSTRVIPELEDALTQLGQLSQEKQERWANLSRLWLDRPEEFDRAESQTYIPSLNKLLDGMTPENIHPEFHFGPPVGKERFWED